MLAAADSAVQPTRVLEWERELVNHVFVTRRIRDVDFLYANRLDHTVRLIAAAANSADGLFLSVRPALLPRQTILASVSGSYNAIWAAGAHGADGRFGRLFF